MGCNCGCGFVVGRFSARWSYVYVFGGILRPVARLVCLVCLVIIVVCSGGADDFVLCNCVVNAMKIDWGFVLCCAACFVVVKIKIIY